MQGSVFINLIMWRFKPFMPKEQTGLEGRSIDVGNLKIHIRNAIAEGGFSCVYLARDAIHSSKQYALKHIICNDEESLELVMKEISVMKLLRGHPNIVSLLAHTILDMGRTKEALLVMEFCEKSLVTVLESRGGGYFEEKQILSIFRDVCNAVFAMHCQSPPIAHRDLKPENLLLGSDGMWKLCDFGSTSTNHKRFERPEEMGIEEDTIRKHTTPVYRAPEMWDLFRRELINEKVDIWALGCLLYRICYFKSAFDGESKLQILNGNYRIPELPKYSSIITDLIRDMLQDSPDTRPDITQARALLDWPFISMNLGISITANKVPQKPRRSPPPPPSSREQDRNVSPPLLTSRTSGGGAPMGAFWSTQHVKESLVAEDSGGPVFDEEPTSQSTSKHDSQSPENRHPLKNASPPKEQNIRTRPFRRSAHGNSLKRFDDGPSKDFEIRFFPEDADHGTEKVKVPQSDNLETFQNETFNTFVAEFDTSKLDSGNNKKKLGKEEELEAQVDRLKEQLKQINLEKAEITSKYEKLSAICRSQRQEIQDLKQALPARIPSPNIDASKNQTSPGSWQSTTPPKMEVTAGELQQVIFANNSASPDTKPWQAFPEEPKPLPQLKNTTKSARTTNSHHKKQAPDINYGLGSRGGFETDSFTAIPARAQKSRPPGHGNNSQRFGDTKSVENKSASQPTGWAGF
ncbi:hypothetical protein HHK36_011998 [Tetracentron sinense]|uniref:non-specific serine/threonine protein kinase n=1 Tax=Tetracentron sinense TaxID=13715 RepID=A0A835DKE1_TETSI|nr:hypothetical protein HHK36_011998 [Tetracentron sinense]